MRVLTVMLIVVLAAPLGSSPRASSPLHARSPRGAAPQPAAPADVTFEAASVRRNRSADARVMIQTPPGAFTATNIALRGLVRFGYRLQDFQVTGGPDWQTSDRFDVVAKARGDASPDEIRLMVRALLTERFMLKTHLETRELPLYALIVADRGGRLGARLRKSDATCDGREATAVPPATADADQAPRCGYLGPLPGVSLAAGRSMMAFRGLTMDALARLLVTPAGRAVIDRTGLAGYFDGEFDFTSEFGPPPPPPGAPDPLDRPSLPSLFTILPEQLGLRLEPQRGPVEVLVIEGAQRPSEN
jgi:uncharacterized protein (TIGR03435 family)